MALPSPLVVASFCGRVASPFPRWSPRCLVVDSGVCSSAARRDPHFWVARACDACESGGLRLASVLLPPLPSSGAEVHPGVLGPPLSP
eukprot:11429434-Alexandrium_andersonii.AAC.1